MAGCDDTRQLTEQQRVDGYTSQRNAGVQQAIRPFTGNPSPANLVDYLNRELFPVVKATRQKTNDIYRQVTDNAPSANPLAYYFSVNTGNADPTVGRVRLNASPQNAATVIRVSQTNGRLQDAGAWLDIMAGSATAPLGVVTVYDATDPSRFLRFDLNTMVDQGAYWDLGVTPIEASHTDPFVDSEGVVLSFIGGVSAAGSTVPPSSVSPIANNTFVGNISGATAAPSAVALSSLASSTIVFDAASHSFQRAAISGGDITASQNSNSLTINADAVTDAKLRNSSALSVIGRSANSTGDPADIATTSGSSAVLRESGGTLGFGTVANAGLSTMPSPRLKGRTTASTGVVEDLVLVDSTSVTWNSATGGSISLQRAALTGEVTASANANATTITRSTDFIWTGKHQWNNWIVLGTQQNESAFTGGALNSTLADNVTRLYVLINGDGEIQTITPAGGTTTAGRVVYVYIVGSGTKTIKHSFSGGGVGRIQCPGNIDFFAGNRESFLLVGDGVNGWLASFHTGAGLRDGDKGDITVTSSGTVWTIDNDVVTDAKLRNSGALSVIGRSANSSGDPADVSASAASDAVLRESGSTLGFGTVATGGIADNAVTDAKIRDSGALSVIGRSAATSGDPADILATTFFPDGKNVFLRTNGTPILGFGKLVLTDMPQQAADTFVGNITTGFAVPVAVPLADVDSTSIIYDATTHTFQRAALTGDVTASQDGNALTIAADAVTDAKLRNSSALSVIGRAANSTGDPADIVAGADDRLLTRVSSALAFTQLTDGMVPTNTIALTKLANVADNTFLGNVSGATAAVSANSFASLNSTTVIYETTGKTLIRQALTGDVTAAQNSNTTVIAADAVTDTKLRNSAALSVIGRSANSTGDPGDITAVAASGAVLRESGSTIGFGTIATGGLADDSVTDVKLRNSGALSVIGRSANSSGDPADISAVAASGSVLRESGSTVGWGTIATAGIAANAVTNAKLAQMTQATIKGRASGAGTGDPVDLTATQVNAIVGSADITLSNALVLGTQQNASAFTGTGPNTLDVTLADNVTRLYILIAGDGDVQTITPSSGTTTTGRVVYVYIVGSGLKTIKHAFTGGGVGRLQCPQNRDHGFGNRQSFWLVGDGANGWLVSLTPPETIAANSLMVNATTGAAYPAALSVGTNTVLGRVAGNIVAAQLATGQIADTAVTSAKLRDSQALSLIGRSANSTGVPADIVATASSDSVMREQGGTINWGTIASGGIASNAVTDAKLRQGGALSVIGRSANSTGNVADIAASAASDAVLRENGSTIGFGTIATGGIANNAVTDAKLRQGTALTVIGRSANSTGNVADIAAANDGEVLRRSGTALGFGTVATAGITDAAVTLAKQANLAQSTIIGRVEGAGTGVPQALTPANVVDIIDQDIVTRVLAWSAGPQVFGLGLMTNTSQGYNGVFSSTEASPAVNNKAIGDVTVWRLNPTTTPVQISGMVPTQSGQIVYILSVTTGSNIIQVMPENTSSTAANRFLIGTTSLDISAQRGMGFWYDAINSRWRPLGLY